MYSVLKKITLALFPKKTLKQLEPLFRSILYLFYKGRNFQCNLCEAKLRTFITHKEELLCPKCGSLGRTRRLWHIVESNYLKPNTAVLDFSPSRSLYRKFKSLKNIQYTSTDLSTDFISDFQYDITAIATQENTFDLILCYHILEHIEHDMKAINELYRVLKPSGTCIVQTPFKEGETYENASIISEAERTLHFGQKDHVRIYAASDLKKRLEKGGFSVELKNYTSNSVESNGFKKEEIVLICTK